MLNSIVFSIYWENLPGEGLLLFQKVQAQSYGKDFWKYKLKLIFSATKQVFIWTFYLYLAWTFGMSHKARSSLGVGTRISNKTFIYLFYSLLLLFFCKIPAMTDFLQELLCVPVLIHWTYKVNFYKTLAWESSNSHSNLPFYYKYEPNLRKFLVT